MKDHITPMIFQNFDWRDLYRGEEIEVLHNGLVTSRGVVDDFTFDRRIFWLNLSRGGCRRMFHQAGGWQVRAGQAVVIGRQGRGHSQ